MKTGCRSFPREIFPFRLHKDGSVRDYRWTVLARFFSSRWSTGQRGGGCLRHVMYMLTCKKKSWDTFGHGHVWFAPDLLSRLARGPKILAPSCAIFRVEIVAKTAFIPGYI